MEANPVSKRVDCGGQLLGFDMADFDAAAPWMYVLLRTLGRARSGAAWQRASNRIESNGGIAGEGEKNLRGLVGTWRTPESSRAPGARPSGPGPGPEGPGERLYMRWR